MIKNPSSISLLIVAILTFGLPAPIWPQPSSIKTKEADDAFQNKEFQKANNLYKILLNEKENDPSLWYKYAGSAREVRDYLEAEKYYTKVLESQDDLLYGMTRFWLGQVKKNLGKYEEAIEAFRDFAQLGQDQYYTYWAANEIQICQWAAGQPDSGDNIQIDLLDENINGYYSESAPIEMGNQLFYSTDRSVFAEDKHQPKRRQTKMMVSKNLERGRPIPNEFVEDGKHFSNTAFSHDWQRMYFTVCEYINSEETRCEIYYRDQDKKGDWVHHAERLPGHINMDGFTATHPAIGYDQNTKTETLYFASDRPDGKGGMDIWYCEITKNGFSQPVNFWEINTPENEVTPAYHTESQTFTFSSDGYRGFGGFDIYNFSKKGGLWRMVHNMGMPINSSYDDLFFSKNTPGNRAYFSSNRPGSRVHRSKYIGCCTDIYRVYFK